MKIIQYIIWKGRGLSKSQQNDYYTKNSYTRMIADEYIEGVSTYWQKNLDSLSTNNFINDSYYYMIFKQDNTDINLKRYWQASRYTLILNQDFYWGLHTVVDKIGGTGLDDNQGQSPAKLPSAVRPMVEINLTQVSLDTTTTSGGDAQNAYKLVKR